MHGAWSMVHGAWYMVHGRDEVASSSYVQCPSLPVYTRTLAVNSHLSRQVDK